MIYIGIYLEEPCNFILWIYHHADDRESHQRDLYEVIKKGEFPKWKMYIQVMTEEEANNMPYNPFDLTKGLYNKDFPLIPV